MPAKGIEIHRLESKIRVVAQTMCEIGELTNDSNRELATKAGINYDRLKKSWQQGRMTSNLQSMLARYAGFDANDPTWIDGEVSPAERSAPGGDKYRGRDTVENFRHMIRTCHDLPAGQYIRIDDQRPQLADSNILTFEVNDSGQATEIGENIQIFLTLVIEPGFINQNLAFGFNKVRLRLDLTRDNRIRAERDDRELAEIILRDAKLTKRGGQHNIEWFLTATSGILMGEYATRDGPLCQLQQAAIGDTFAAEVAVRPVEGYLCSLNGKDLPPAAKQKIIKVLAAKRLVGVADSNGWLSLGRQELRVIRGEQL